MTTSDDHDSQRAAEREFRIAMAAEARAERELRERIKKWFYTSVAAFVVLFIIAMLFF